MTKQADAQEGAYTPDVWTVRWRASLRQQDGESEREWALRLIGCVEQEYHATLRWVVESMRLGRIIAKLQRAVSKARRRTQEPSGASADPAAFRVRRSADLSWFYVDDMTLADVQEVYPGWQIEALAHVTTENPERP